MFALAFKLHQSLRELSAAEEGQDLVEYALLVSLIALACMAAVGQVANAVTTIFSNISTTLA